MSRLNTTLAAGAAAALMAALGAAWAQTSSSPDNPEAAAQVTVTADTPKDSPQILFFRDQGISPETDPAAHLLLIHDQPPVAAAHASTTVAQSDQSTTDMAPSATPQPEPTQSSASSTDTINQTSTTDNSAAGDKTPAPKADRN